MDAHADLNSQRTRQRSKESMYSDESKLTLSNDRGKFSFFETHLGCCIH